MPMAKYLGAECQEQARRTVTPRVPISGNNGEIPGNAAGNTHGSIFLFKFKQITAIYARKGINVFLN